MPINFLNNTSISAALTVATTGTFGGTISSKDISIKQLGLKNL